MNDTFDRLKAVQARIDQACVAAGRRPGEVALLAVSKRHSPDKVMTLNRLGLVSFGENHLQEALEKQRALRSLDLQWHFIGNVQSNKTRAIAENFQWVQSVDRQKILRRISEQRPEALGPINVCLQVNIDREPQKAGASAEEILPLAALAGSLANIRLRGLMAIPMFTADPAQQRRSFARVRALFEKLRENGHDLDTLSMGMSADLEAAIAEGSTMVRIGTDLFGERGA